MLRWTKGAHSRHHDLRLTMSMPVIHSVTGTLDWTRVFIR
jgi:hypothetical protein